jgi:inner membrane protein
MPTILTHAVVPIAIGLGLGKHVVSPRLIAAGAFASILPDFDVVAFRLNIAYADAFGHRGASHSLVAALLFGILALAFARRLNTTRFAAFIFVTVSAFSHGLLDTFTNGGHGVALWWPLSLERIFSHWQVIEVSPLSLRRLFSERGIAVLQSEFLWVWLPAVCTSIVLLIAHRRFYSNLSLNRDGNSAATR